MAYDIINRRWVRTIEYGVGRFSIDPEGVLAQMHATYDWVISHTGLSSQNLAKLVWDKTVCVRAEMRIVEEPNGSQETLIEISRPFRAAPAA